jgi:hypothetical protein
VVAGRLTRGVVAAHSDDTGSPGEAGTASMTSTRPAGALGDGQYRTESGYVAPVYGGLAEPGEQHGHYAADPTAGGGLA